MDGQTYRLCHNKCHTSSLGCAAKNVDRGRGGGRGARVQALYGCYTYERLRKLNRVSLSVGQFLSTEIANKHISDVGYHLLVMMVYSKLTSR